MVGCGLVAVLLLLALQPLDARTPRRSKVCITIFKALLSIWFLQMVLIVRLHALQQPDPANTDDRGRPLDPFKGPAKKQPSEI